MNSYPIPKSPNLQTNFRVTGLYYPHSRMMSAGFTIGFSRRQISSFGWARAPGPPNRRCLLLGKRGFCVHHQETTGAWTRTSVIPQFHWLVLNGWLVSLLWVLISLLIFNNSCSIIPYNLSTRVFLYRYVFLMAKMDSRSSIMDCVNPQNV